MTAKLVGSWVKLIRSSLLNKFVLCCFLEFMHWLMLISVPHLYSFNPDWWLGICVTIYVDILSKDVHHPHFREKTEDFLLQFFKCSSEVHQYKMLYLGIPLPVRSKKTHKMLYFWFPFDLNNFTCVCVMMFSCSNHTMAKVHVL